MQKKIIALAVAGLASTAAFAQTNVTVYGIADAAVAYTNFNGGTRGNAAESHGRDTLSVVSGGLAGSRLGFKGTEDLGNGLKAVFVLEEGFNIDNGTMQSGGTGATAAFQRQAFVGLSSKAGTLSLGRQYAPGYYAGAEYDALVGSTPLSPLRKAAGGIGATIVATDPARWNNTINYVSPNFYGVTAQVMYRAGERANEISIDQGYALGLKYAGGPVSVSYVYHNTETSASGLGAAVTTPTGTTPGSTGAQQEHFIGASVDLKVVKLIATAQVSDWGNRQFAGLADRGEAYTIGAIVPVGKGNIHAAAGYADLNGSQRTASGAGAKGSLTSATIAYTYGLSKRTTLYTGLNYTDVKAGTNMPLSSVDSNYAVPTINGNTGGITTTFAAGVNHAF
jgi:predicted porin